MRIGPEAQIQIALKQFCDLHKIPMMHFAGERKCSLQYGGFLKKLGSRAGVSDCYFPRGNNIFSCLWMELKSKGKKPTKLQIKFMEDMAAEGHATTWCDNIDEAIEFIRVFYSL